MKLIALFALWCVALLTGCGSTAPRQSARREPVWVLPAVSAPSATPTASSHTLPTAATDPAAVAIAPTNANVPAIQTNTPPPVANVLSPADIKELADKGVSDQTILRASRAIRIRTEEKGVSAL